MWDYGENKILTARPGIRVEAGQTPEGTYTFGSPIKESDICQIMTRLYTYRNSGEEIYT
ncbi:MAG: hypothetical protein IJP86_02900 [Synergistaceae bacterium]|nr:hypothetical protein [Synergistaceae bacterium]